MTTCGRRCAGASNRTGGISRSKSLAPSGCGTASTSPRVASGPSRCSSFRARRGTVLRAQRRSSRRRCRRLVWDLAAVHKYSEENIALSRRLHDPERLVYALSLLGGSADHTLEQISDIYREAYAIAARLGDEWLT